MYAVLLCVASAAVGIEVGWQKMPEGGMEYIIQLDPQALETLGTGQEIKSDIPTSAGEIRAYRIVVGKEKLPRETPPEPKKNVVEEPKSDEPGRPWLSLTMALLGLAASVSLNVFLGWIAWDSRRRICDQSTI